MLTIRHNRLLYADRALKESTLNEFLEQPVVKQKIRPIDGKMGELLEEVCAKYHTKPEEVLSKQRFKNVSQARAEFMCILHFKHGYTIPRLSYLMNMDVTSVRHIVGLRKSSKAIYADLRERFK